MKKSNWMLFCFLALASLLSSCKKEKQDISKQIIGTWKGTANPNGVMATFEITFGENGTVTHLKWGSLGGTLGGNGSNWSINGSAVVFHIEAVNMGGIDKADCSGTISANNVVGTFSNTSVFPLNIVTTGNFTIIKQ